jgi:hypothetical protein
MGAVARGLGHRPVSHPTRFSAQPYLTETVIGLPLSTIWTVRSERFVAGDFESAVRYIANVDSGYAWFEVNWLAIGQQPRRAIDNIVGFVFVSIASAIQTTGL